MRILVGAVVSLLLAVLTTLWVMRDNGYVLIGYGNWTIEGSLALFVAAGLLLFMLLYAAIRLIIQLWGAPETLSGWLRRRKNQRAQRALTRGLVEMAEGRWKSAEKKLIRYASQSETPLLNYLAAARAAQLQEAYGRRDDYLHLAHESMPSADIAVGLTQAELQLARRQNEQALATLMHVRSLSPKHSYVLKLLKKLYQRLGEWEKLHALLPELKKRKVVTEAEYQSLQEQVYSELLLQETRSAGDVQQLWQGMPKALKKRQQLLDAYCQRLYKLGELASLEQVIANALKHEWSSNLIQLYGRIQSHDKAKQMALAESWLKKRPEDAELLMTLSRLALQSKLWGKARSYLEASIAIAPTVESYQELGLLLEHLGDKERAMECYRKGLNLEHTEPLSKLPPVVGRQAIGHQEQPSAKSRQLEHL